MEQSKKNQMDLRKLGWNSFPLLLMFPFMWQELICDTPALLLNHSAPELMKWLIRLVKLERINWVAYGNIIQFHEDNKQILYFLVYTCSIFVVPINILFPFYLNPKVQNLVSMFFPQSKQNCECICCLTFQIYSSGT